MDNDRDRILFAKTLDDALCTETVPMEAFKSDDDLYQFVNLTTPPVPHKLSFNLLQVQQQKQLMHQQQLQQLLVRGGANIAKVEQVVLETPPDCFDLADVMDQTHAPPLEHPHVCVETALQKQFKPTLALIDKRGDLTKPINALGPLCFSGFYLVSLTRTIVRNRTVPRNVRKGFMAPQLHFAFTIRDKREHKWRNIPTVQIPYDKLSAAGEWLRLRLGVVHEAYTFKHIKDALQKVVTDAWADGAWHGLVDVLGAFDDVSDEDLEDVVQCESISGRAKGTPEQFFRQINCHKGAADIRRDVDGAISARESLRWVLAHLGLNASGCNISIAKFREEVFPLWKHQCAYVREHEATNCCQFYDGGYFKKIMIHKHLYNVNGCSSSYHVKDLFEGLDEVIKVWSNPTGMCVREAKCAAGLRYNVDKSFQSGIRSYSKAKFLEAAPHTANEFLGLERQLHEKVQDALRLKQQKHLKCRKALKEIEIRCETLSQRQLPDMLRHSDTELNSAQASPGGRKRKRAERDADSGGLPSTPREQKRKHAHLSLKRKEAAEMRVRQYLELLREDCQKQQTYLESVKKHGDECGCFEVSTNEISAARYPTTANVPVA